MREFVGEYEVVVVGGGPAGGAIALELARRGVNVALAEACAFPRPKLCGEYLSPEGAAAIERLGLEAELRAAGGEPIDRVRLTTPTGRVLEASVSRPGEPRGLGMSRSTLDEFISSAARRAGARVLERSRVGLPILDNGRVAGVQARDDAGRPVRIRARLIVAANGRHSALVRATGVRRRRATTAHFGLKRHLSVPDPALDEPPGTVGLHLIQGGYVGACRVEGGVTNLCGLLPESRAGDFRGDLDVLASRTFPINPALARLWESSRRVGDWKTVAGVRIESSRARCPGILYAGDCRGTVDPLGGQGMTMALLGAEMAVAAILGALSPTKSLSSFDYVSRYESDWHDRFDRRIALCRLFHHALVNPGSIDLVARLGGVGALALAIGYRMTRDRAS